MWAELLLTASLICDVHSAEMAEGNVHFEYMASQDIHLAFPVFRIVTELDCKRWLDCYRAYCEPHGRKLDFIFVTDMFSIEPSAARTWVKYRDILVSTHIRYGVRVASGANPTLERAVNRWGISEIAPDVTSAAAMIEESRRRAAAG
jgi:hypothetical protein